MAVRFIRLALVIAALISLTAVAAVAQGAVTLALRFAPGEVMEYDVSVSGSGGLRAPDGDFSPVGMQGSMRLIATVAEVLPDGNARLQVRMPRADFQVSIAQDRARISYENGRVRWYSNGREQAPPDADLSQAPLLVVPVEVIVSPAGAFVEAIMPTMPGMPDIAQLAPGLGAPGLKNLGEPLFPEAPVRVGETWRKHSQVTPFGPSVMVTVTDSRTLDELIAEGGLTLARISGYRETRLRTSSIGLAPGQLDASVAIPDLRYSVTSSEFLNTEAGRLIRGEYDSAFVARATFDMGGKPQEASLEARFHSSVQAR